MVECQKRPECGQVTESGRGIFPKAALQIIREDLRPGGIPGQSQCKRGAELHIQPFGKLQRCHRAPPCLGSIFEEAFPQRHWGLIQTRPFRLGSGLS